MAFLSSSVFFASALFLALQAIAKALSAEYPLSFSFSGRSLNLPGGDFLDNSDLESFKQVQVAAVSALPHRGHSSCLPSLLPISRTFKSLNFSATEFSLSLRPTVSICRISSVLRVLSGLIDLAIFL